MVLLAARSEQDHFLYPCSSFRTNNCIKEAFLSIFHKKEVWIQKSFVSLPARRTIAMDKKIIENIKKMLDASLPKRATARRHRPMSFIAELVQQ